MGFNKNELDKLVLFVKVLKNRPGNEDFINKLREVLDIKTPPVVAYPSNDKLNAIEKYLGLDYALDSAEPTIDYSFVVDEDVRHQLEADYREMMRYRYGTRGHKIDFMEYCRYVQLQVEMLLNYYYYQRFRDSSEILTHIKDILSGMKIDNLTYAVQLWSFCKEQSIAPTKTVLDRVRDIRNKQSHRTTSDNDIEDTMVKAKEFALKNGLFIDYTYYTFIPKDVSSLQKEQFIEITGMKMDDYNKLVAPYMFLKVKPYKEILESLCIIVSKVSQLI